MVRLSWVLLRPLLLSLIVCAGALAAILLFAVIVYFVIAGGVDQLGSVLPRVRPAMITGAVVFGALAVFRWVSHLIGLRRRLRETQTTLQEFSNWPVPIQIAWLKGEGAPPAGANDR